MMSTVAHFNGLDYAIIGIVLLSLIISFFRGFLREAISLITWFCAFVAALKFSPIFTQWFHFIPHDKTRYVVCAVATFIVVMIIGMLINKLAHALVTTSGLGFFDRILGVVFGVARGLLVAVILLVVINASPFQKSDFAKQSQLAPHFQPIVAHFDALIPAEVRSVSSWLDKITDQVSKYINHKTQ